jgi:hypothetical protein
MKIDKAFKCHDDVIERSQAPWLSSKSGPTGPVIAFHTPVAPLLALTI